MTNIYYAEEFEFLKPDQHRYLIRDHDKVILGIISKEVGEDHWAAYPNLWTSPIPFRWADTGAAVDFLRLYRHKGRRPGEKV